MLTDFAYNLTENWSLGYFDAVTKPERLYYFTLIAAPIEEGAKFLVFYIIARLKKTILEPTDIFVQATCVALAFAISENFLYGLSYGVNVLLERSIFATLGHIMLTVIVGFGYAYHRFYGRTEKKIVRRGVMAFMFFLSSILHGVYNFTLMSTNNPEYSTLIDIAISIIGVLVILFAFSTSAYRSYRFTDHKVAIPRIQKALSTNPKSTVLRKRLAIYLMVANRYHEAAAILTILHQADSKDIVVSYFLAPAIWFCGETSEALDILDDVVAKMSKFKRQKLERIMRRILVSESDKWSYLDKYHAAEFIGDLRE
jgi:protease PrsW